jgi:tetratricopeptide (TPR) repeat protein
MMMMPVVLPPSMVPAIVVLAAATATSATEEYQRGRTAFLRGQYQRAISVLHPLLYPELRLESEEEVIVAHRMLGVSYLFENQPDQARIEFRKLLELQPDYRFDALLDPPRVVEFFNEIVRQQQKELTDIEFRLRRREAELARRSSQVVERRIERRSFPLTFVPFGVGQFQNGQDRKGWLFLGVEGVLATTSMAAFVTNFAMFGAEQTRACLVPVVLGECPPGRADQSEENFSRNLTRVQVVSGGLFFAVAIFGIVDAIRNFQEEVVIGETVVGPPPTSLRIVPTLSPLAQGAALSVTF